jgi:hypothetical protein
MAALSCFALMPVALAVVVVGVLGLVLSAGAVAELADRRVWRQDDETLRRAAVRRARRYLDGS